MANFVYLIGDPTTKTCAVVDPAWDVKSILEAAARDGFELTHALVTHNHPDHTNGLSDLLRARDLPVYVHHSDAHALKAFKGNLKPTRGGESVEIGALELGFLHTPGHTPGSQCFLVRERLVSGDTLFIKGCGRVDLPNSDPEKMYHSLRKISALPEETLVLPGHDYGDKPCAKLSEEKKANPFLATAQRALPDFLKVVGF